MYAEGKYNSEAGVCLGIRNGTRTPVMETRSVSDDGKDIRRMGNTMGAPDDHGH